MLNNSIIPRGALTQIIKRIIRQTKKISSKNIAPHNKQPRPTKAFC